MICYIYTPSQEGAVDAQCLARKDENERRCWCQLPTQAVHKKALHVLSHLDWAGFLLLEVSVLIKHVGDVAEVLCSNSQRRGHVLKGVGLLAGSSAEKA